MSAPKRIFRIKVTLRDTRPPIWRRLLVRDTMSLREFHGLLQLAMGWTDSHMHQFKKGQIHYGSPHTGLEGALNESKVKLEDVFRKPKDRILYEYDFGDGWLHDVALEEIMEPEPAGKYPWILAGKRACPPEDCGGVYGYYRMLEALADPTDPEHEDMLEWLGEGFDPEDFDAYERNVRLHGGWSRPREPR